MNIILDNIAIWKPKLGKGLTVRKSPVGTRYQKASSNILALADKPIIRYAKNYQTEDGVKFCLFVRTFADDEKSVEKELDAYAETLESTDVTSAIAGADMTHFIYSNRMLEVKS